MTFLSRLTLPFGGRRRFATANGLVVLLALVSLLGAWTENRPWYGHFNTTIERRVEIAPADRTVGTAPEQQVAVCPICGSKFCTGLDQSFVSGPLGAVLLPADVVIVRRGIVLRLQQPRAPPQAAASASTSFDPRGPPALV
ncbi:hypothetical protein SAMN02745126_05562 [Enhydrobacter aerosaccus]|uniref:DUF2946 domain-containing protein n=1 Tax=Enhydrobacter aerosaccus TaxID=225324 RepID=A0A1T4T3P5_9HYPH|nr:hypothetical protein [Enhydrobacter aerosaccus]SKA34861.1 hypothetical protein SAMN02745126_05562 [Enhydrobacter aerosaccus]